MIALAVAPPRACRPGAGRRGAARPEGTAGRCEEGRAMGSVRYAEQTLVP